MWFVRRRINLQSALALRHSASFATSQLLHFPRSAELNEFQSLVITGSSLGKVITDSVNLSGVRIPGVFIALTNTLQPKDQQQLKLQVCNAFSAHPEKLRPVSYQICLD